MKSKLKRESFLVTANQVIAEGAVLLRNVLLARMLGPEQMGLAVMLAITLRCLEMFSYLAADRLLVQARDGNASRFQANAQGLELARGLLSGIALCTLAYPAAIAFGYPDMAWAFAALGLVPVLRGFAHMDYRRLQRALKFGPTFKVESLANIIGTLSVWPAWALAGDFSALVWVSLVQAVAYVSLSHVFARRKYRLRFDRVYIVRMLQFGWPMLVNSLLMFGVFQGDRLVVAFSVSVEELSRYALALQLGLLPTLVLARASLSLLLPLLAKQQGCRPVFLGLYQQAMLVLVLFACLFITGYTLLGNQIITLMFGEAFAISPIVLAWLGYALAIRIIRVGPSTAALALGDSQTLMRANLPRLGGLILAVWLGLTGMGLAYIAAAAAIGETAALLAGIVILFYRQGVATSVPVLLSISSLVGAFISWLMFPLHLSLITASAGILLITLFVAGLLYRLKQNIRSTTAGAAH
ncbi:MAG: oligosaccharide flippase family protein [Proteobacteria bacterium]|nr:oligosaccharide flippase family protein [Pseudomonadota bacterium]